MNIFNVRKGFATNSSSSHSVIELKEDKGRYGVVTDEYTDFGWEFFTAADKTSKENYIGSCVISSLKQLKNNTAPIKTLATKILGEELYERAKNVSIDHQSVITLPRTFDNKMLNEDFIKDLLSYIQNERVVIVGGHDNTEEYHPLINENKSSPSKADSLKVESTSNHYVARKDRDYWTIFNRNDGEKVRFSFTSNIEPTKATKPELADIKITDYCPYDCGFCYQNSTVKGKHSKLSDIKKIATELQKAEVFEIALGGGETTLHPKFVEILKIFKSKNIVPNFTTKNLNLLRQSNANEIIKHCGAMAYSVQSVDDMMKVKTSYIDFENRNKIGISAHSYLSYDMAAPWSPKITFQIVMGVMSQEEFQKMIYLAMDFGARVTLLGYKENGRGSSFAPYDYSNWLDFIQKIKKDQSITISIDTALATEFEKELLEKNIDTRTFHTNEGAFSVYIDAVKMKFYPSSYVGLENCKDFNENWLEGYKDMNVKPSNKKTIPLKSVV